MIRTSVWKLAIWQNFSVWNESKCRCDESKFDCAPPDTTSWAVGASSGDCVWRHSGWFTAHTRVIHRMSAGHHPIAVFPSCHISLSQASIRELLFLRDLHSLIRPYVLHLQNKKNFIFVRRRKWWIFQSYLRGEKLWAWKITDRERGKKKEEKRKRRRREGERGERSERRQRQFEFGYYIFGTHTQNGEFILIWPFKT